MDFRVLGPLEVSDGGRAVALGGVKQRSLLAILLQHPNAIASTDHLLAELWGDAPPARADNSLHVYVSRLRKALGSDRGTHQKPRTARPEFFDNHADWQPLPEHARAEEDDD